MKKTILSVMKKVMLLALLLTMGNIYSYSSPVQVSMNIIDKSRAQKGQALLRPRCCCSNIGAKPRVNCYSSQ